jgi:hypothetical protein
VQQFWHHGRCLGTSIVWILPSGVDDEGTAQAQASAVAASISTSAFGQRVERLPTSAYWTLLILCELVVLLYAYGCRWIRRRRRPFSEFSVVVGQVAEFRWAHKGEGRWEEHKHNQFA